MIEAVGVRSATLAQPRSRFAVHRRPAFHATLGTFGGMSRAVLKGRCGCRAVAFEVADGFVEAYNCHCSNCRATTGSYFKPWGEIDPQNMKVTKGADSLVVQGDANARHAVRCQECFSLLYWTGYEGKIRIPYGTLADEPTLKPTGHIFVGSKASWHEILDDLPQYEGSPWS
jgi:hypothetical protein